MATASSATLLINIVTNAKGAVAGMDKASGRMGKFQSGLQKAAVPAAIAGAAIIKFGSDAVRAASRTEQAMGGVDAVFGKNAKKVKAWSDNSAKSVGLSKSQYGEMATVLGAQLKNMGVPMDKIAGQTNKLITKGADLSAMFGGTAAEAVDALGSALRGETDPIEKYGVSVKQADIDAALLADTTAKLAAEQKKAGKGTASHAKLTKQAAAAIKKMTPAQEKAARTQALLGLVNEQTASSVGKFADESDSAAGAAQISAAQFEDAKSALGEALLPAVVAVTKKLGGLAKWMSKNTTTVQIIGGAILTLATAVFVLIGALKAYELALKVIQIVQKATWLGNPIFLVIAAVIALGVAFIVLYKKSKTFRDFVNAMWSGIKTVAKAVAGFVKAVWSAALNGIKAATRVAVQVFKTVWRGAVQAVKGYVQILRAYFSLVFGVIKGLIKTVVAVFKGDWRGAAQAVRGIIASFRDFFRSVFHALPDPIQRVIEKIKSGLGGAFSTIKSKAGALGDVLSKPFDTMRDSIQWVIDKVGDLIDALGRIKVPHISLPKIPGLGKSAPSPSVSTYAAPRVAGLGARAVGGTSSGGGGVNINVTGALDPEAVARQIQRILQNHDRRVGMRVS